MDAVRVVQGTAVPLGRSDVDTDQIIPSEWLKRVERTGFGRGLFAEWRDDRDFVLNQPEYAGARILLAGANFGTGSSREHAVWALTDYGFRAVIAPRFGDIFRTNATKAGLLPVALPEATVTALQDAVEADPGTEVVVDLDNRVVLAESAGIKAPFEIDDYTRWRLMEGLDDIGLTLRDRRLRARPALVAPGRRHMSSLAGQKVLVTGASAGIGAGIARRMAAEGAVVGICARRRDRLEEVLAECRVHSPRSRMWVVDLSDLAELATGHRREEGVRG